MSFPIEIHLHKKSALLELKFEDGTHVKLPCEYLRVFSPSADAHGHGKDPRKLVFGKREVNILRIEPVGNYAVKLIFDDGHATGLYSWELLYQLSIHYEQNWQNYLQRLSDTKLMR